MSLSPARSPTFAHRADITSIDYLGGTRPDARVEAALQRWIASYRERFPNMDRRTVRVRYQTADGWAHAAFPPVGQAAPRRFERGSGDAFTRAPSGGFNLFAFLFGNRRHRSVAPSDAMSPRGPHGMSLRAGPSGEPAVAERGQRVVMANAHATRNRPLDPHLMGQLERMARELGVRVEVYSGGQPAPGEEGERTGTTRHDHGFAADVRIYRDGQLLTGNALAQVVDYWLRHDIGGVGYGMAQGGLHLDVHTRRAPFWAYSHMPSAVRQVVTVQLGDDVPALDYA